MLVRKCVDQRKNYSHKPGCVRGEASDAGNLCAVLKVEELIILCLFVLETADVFIDIVHVRDFLYLEELVLT